MQTVTCRKSSGFHPHTSQMRDSPPTLVTMVNWWRFLPAGSIASYFTDRCILRFIGFALLCGLISYELTLLLEEIWAMIWCFCFFQQTCKLPALPGFKKVIVCRGHAHILFAFCPYTKQNKWSLFSIQLELSKKKDRNRDWVILEMLFPFFLDFSGIWFDLNRPGKLFIVGFCYRFLLCKSWQERIMSCLQKESEDTDTGWMTYVALYLYNTFRILLHLMTQTIAFLPSQWEFEPELCHS